MKKSLKQQVLQKEEQVLQKDKLIEELEYKYSMALAREAQLKCRLFDTQEKKTSFWKKIKFWG